MNRRALVLVLIGLAFAGIAAAEEDAVTKALDACKPEIESYCSQVTPGEGRLLACFFAHEDKLSGSCNWALYEASVALDELVSAVAYVATECRDDMLEFCGDVQMGEGRVGVCLVEHEAEVSTGCQAAMADVELEIVEE